MIYDDAWIPPWRKGLAQARCQNPGCSQAGAGMLVVAITLADGLCAQCARSADESHRELRPDV